MSEESKLTDPATTAEAAAEVVQEAMQGPAGAEDDEGSSSGEEAGTAEVAESAEGAKTKKKKSRKRKIKNALMGKKDGDEADTSTPASKLNKEQLQMLLDSNPALRKELEGQAGVGVGVEGKGKGKMDVEALLKKLNVNELLTGMAPGGKNKKDMASHTFWRTQPVPSFDEARPVEDGPIKMIDVDKVEKEPSQMYPGFEWVTMDLDDENQLEEVYELLSNHYVEDDEAMFRFKYSSSFINWTLKAPGWRKEWHVGVRASGSKKLVAFISGIPVDLRVRKNVLHCSEINFLCVHKKLRSKRLAPVLIKEVTRRCYLANIFQAIYTAGVLIPTPVSTCRYFHRALDWEKLHEVGFSPLPPNSTKERQLAKYKLPNKTSTPGLRIMEVKDMDQVLDLLKRYLERSDMAQIFSKEEAEHWLLHNKESQPKEQVIWSYVIEDPKTGKITDFFSYYLLESTIIASKKHKVVRAAYLFYYATEAAFDKDKALLKPRLNALIKDALILAKNAKFDVFNALTLLDNPLFLEEQRFGAGDGQLHFYLFNYRTAPIQGGVDAKNQASEKHMGGVGVVML
ncbi:glycylpeptide N-tetradecanoyltransferas-like protein [Glonium stellatum]|uniref:Glycylpeptide N-tetradecanoyltransferase n=1 Tax=Glonium stellatum TaxID=574774 RepID=A0A8E2EST3_9PEZI|nr:glycylpeptide N-tetradecanoyltransferas-like protein [Glonium stellatum]